MELVDLKELLSFFDQSTLTEFNLKDGSFELYLNKNQAAQVSPRNGGDSHALTPLQTVSLEPATPIEQPAIEKALPEAVPETIEGTPVVSPLVGVVYLKPSPDKPNFKEVGDQVAQGEVLCIVEAMKVMNEITSDISGEIVEILIENEQIVEYNQPLFRVKEG